MEKQRGGRGWLIALSIIAGLVISCAILPLGGMALLLAAAGGSDSGGGPLGPSRWDEQIVSGSGLNRVVIIDVSGVIGAGGDIFGAGGTQDDLLSQIKQAAGDPLVKAVVLRVDSPGGGVVASSEIHAELVKLRDAGKTLVVSMGATAASGGYYISTAAEKIYANKDTFTGSLGVILELTNYGEAFTTLGLKSYVYKSGALKDIGSATREPTAEEDAVLQRVVDEAYQGFVDVIVDGRGLPRERVLEIADGRIYTGAQAKELGLVDELGNLDEAIAGAQGLAGMGDTLVVRYARSSSLRALLLSRLAAPQAQADPLGLRAVTSPPAPQMEYRWRP
ncbi:signal peptide peptidase SppA [Oscillochloris sp. ZM17-4]|uniref:signal peptide peptidase SppA n=1 Tax=Oscillochloris sp. ZM17-4 TaxID=2866714 RepID=UPI001C732DFA|nr:signal peptide peptidase SppA [Oscillochloris sp. ZM17-4]MBX0331006.1 signal peptide peptidase SppA [Oscillochloris sp. ZM17-4]